MTHCIAPAPTLVTNVTELVAHCQVCGVQWEVKSDDRTDAQGCGFCNAPANAIEALGLDKRWPWYMKANRGIKCINEGRRADSNDTWPTLELEYVPQRRTPCFTVIDGDLYWLGVGT